MRIIARSTLVRYWQLHPEVELALKAWYHQTKAARWRTPADLRKEFQTADILADNRVIFNIHGNRFRLVARINYDLAIVFIRFVGTHAEYDRIDASSI